MISDYFLALLDWCKANLFLWNKKSNALFKEGEVWWCMIGINVGVEIYGKGKKFARPVLIFKKFDPYSFFGIPLTTQLKDRSYSVSTMLKGKSGRALLAQARVFDRKRLLDRIDSLNPENFSEIKRAFLELYR